MKGRIVVGVAGRAGSGKDTMGQHLVEEHGFTRISFAGPLKEAAACVFGLSDFELNDRTAKEMVHPYWGLSPRTILQKLGTEGLRQNFGDDILAKVCKKRILRGFQEGCDKVVVTDCRFPNEAKMIYSFMGRDSVATVVRVRCDTRPSALSGDTGSHASEIPLPEDLVSEEIENDGTLQEFKDAVSTWAREKDDFFVD